MHLDFGGQYLFDPETGDGKLLNPHLVPFARLTTASCLVLLGEPGSGKTHTLSDERDAEVTRITAAGGTTLWIDLRDVASPAELADAISARPEWNERSKPLHLFLDSLDECPMGVERISQPLLRVLDSRPSQQLFVRIVCRTAEWPETLERGLQQRWPEMKVFEIAPLRRVDVESAAQAHGIDPTRTLAAIAEREAEAFAIRPITLRFLLTTLAANRPLPSTKVELYSLLCRSLCEEPSETRAKAGVSPDERLALAERVASSLLFGGRTSVFVDPDRGELLDGDLALRDLVGDREPVEGELFADATEPAIRAALATGLFNSRGRGRMGFSHHTFSEFLAARYLWRRQLPMAQVRGLMVHPGLDRIVPQLHGTAAWFASIDAQFFEFVVQRDPMVLLGADAALFDAARKRRLAELILARYDKRQHLDRDFLRREPFEKLAHDGLDAVLRPFARGKAHDTVARRVAIEIAIACKTSALCDDLISIVEDRHDDLAVRSTAAYALAVIGDGDVRARLKPFAMESDPSDEHDDLKGYALRALWPRELTIAEVLSALTPVRARFHGGAYQTFTRHYLTKSASDADLLALLAWTSEQPSRQVLEEPARGLVDAVLEKAWGKLDRSEFVEPYARAALARMRADDSPLIDRVLDEDRWEAQHERRRRVLGSLLSLADNTDERRFCYRRLLREGDFEWLVGLLDEPLSVAARSFLVAFLCDTIMWDASFEVVNLLARIRERHSDLEEAFRPHFDAVPVDSPAAEEARAREARFRSMAAQYREPRVTLPRASERVGALLDRFDRGEIAAYWQIDEELGLDERGYPHLTQGKSDLTTLPGWQQLDGSARARLISAAGRYLQTGRCSPESWIGKQHHWRPALAGYRALRLVMKEDRATFDALGAATWIEWAPIVGGFPGLDEGRARKHGLLVHAYRHAPEAVLAPVLAECLEDDAKLGHVFAHRRLEAIWDDRIAKALLGLAQASIKPESLEDVLDTLLAHHVDSAVAFAQELIALPVPMDSVHRARMRGACTCLMRHALADAWASVYGVLTSDPLFGREVAAEVAQNPETRSKAITSTLPEADCAKLLLWLEKEFPHFEDPSVLGPHAVGVREQIADMRSRVLRDLATRGTIAALEVLRAAEQVNPDTSYLRWAVLEAEHHALARTWKPVAPSDLRALARDASRRLVADEDALMEVVVESLERLDAKLQGQPRAVRFLWDKQRDGSFMPVDENVMSDFIRDHLETDIAKSGIVLNREVQLRPSVAPETGERTDIHVDALSFDPIRRNQDRLTVVVENKGAWNGELRSAMKTQLHGKYLAGTGVRRGVYVVGWFRSALWTRTDRRKRKVPANADLVVAQLREQAEGLSTDGIRIQVVGIDATLPGELKNAKKPKAMTSDRKNDLRGRSRRARSAATGRAKAASAPKTNKAKGLGAAKAAKKVGAVARRTRK